MKQEARIKRNQRIFDWAESGINANQISKMLGKRYKLTATQVRKILKKKGNHEENK